MGWSKLWTSTSGWSGVTKFKVHGEIPENKVVILIGEPGKTEIVLTLDSGGAAKLLDDIRTVLDRFGEKKIDG